MSKNIWDRIYITGAGPGRTDLLTIKAGRLIREADVILHDDLVSEEILNLASNSCQLVNTGKRAGDGIDPGKRQLDIIQKLEQFFREERNVLRLKGGDPMVFGRGVEEFDALALCKISVEIVPGISAGIASCSLVPLPLTERGKSESVLIITGSTIENITRNPEVLAMQLKTGNTAILYMGHSNLAQLSGLLIDQGVKESLPIAAISKVSLPDQKIVMSSLTDAEKDLHIAQLERPLVFVLGEYVRNLNFQAGQE